MLANGKAWHRHCNLWRNTSGLSYVDVPPAETLNVIPGDIEWFHTHSSIWTSHNLYQDIYIRYTCLFDSFPTDYIFQLYGFPSQTEVTSIGLDRRYKYLSFGGIRNGELASLSGHVIQTKKWYQGCNLALMILIGERTTWPKFRATVSIPNI